MPMSFTDDIVTERLKRAKLETAGTPAECRERLALHVEEKYQDYVEAWEIRTGKPWLDMTPEEALELIYRRPELMRNPGILSKLLTKKCK